MLRTFFLSIARPQRLSLLLVLVPLVAACLPETASTRPSSSNSQAASASTNYEQTARRLEQRARTAKGAERDAILLDASRAWFNHGAAIKGLTTLRKVRGELPYNDPIISMLVATGNLIDGRPQVAMSSLNRIRPLVRPQQLPAYLELRARGLAMTGQPVELIKSLTEREAWLRDRRQIDKNRRLIWSSLRDLGRKGHALETPTNAGRNVAGWLALARLHRDNQTNPTVMVRELDAWRSNYQRHMAIDLSGRLFDEDSARNTKTPTRVALLLPVSGRLAAPGSAIRDGFIAAYLDDVENTTRPQVTVYDTANVDATALYKQAVKEGADFVVGPLSKRNVQGLIENKAVATTTLALNYLSESTNAPANFFQFSLAPEHESLTVARRALQDGMTRSIALIPETELGDRLLLSFTTAFENGGGKVIDVQRYNPAEKDFGAPITNLLNLNSSKSRHQIMSTVAGVPLEFEPRRRQDAQFVFLVAAVNQGRLLRPQLNYHYANDLPVMSTSAIFEDDPARNRNDLEGVMFADTPWIIAEDEVVAAKRGALQRAWPNRTKQRGRLFAMGMDAYALMPHLHAQQSPLANGYSGLTGHLTMEFGNRVNRELDIGIVENGSANPLPPLVEDASELDSLLP